MDADSGRVLYERNADRKMLIASTTKILTALVAIEEGDLHDTVKVSREAAYIGKGRRAPWLKDQPGAAQGAPPQQKNPWARHDDTCPPETDEEPF